MKQALVLFFLMIINYSNAQDILADKGIMTLATNEKIDFEKLELAGKQFHYIEPATGEKKEIEMNKVKSVVDKNFNRVFTNRNIIVSTELSQGMLIEKTKADTIAKKPEFPSKAANGCPNGVYYTKEDFINMTPSPTAEVVPREMIGIGEEIVDYIPSECYFYLKKENKKLKKVFAVCYRGEIYFQTQAILNNRNKTDRAQTNNYPNGFVRVMMVGKNYYYTEASLINKWVQGFAYSRGGLNGYSVANAFYDHKGIVWDVKNKEFNIFKSCKDYNEFIKTLYPEGVQECENHQPDLSKVREAIHKIK